MTITPAYMYLIRIQYAILSLNDLFLLVCMYDMYQEPALLGRAMIAWHLCGSIKSPVRL